MNFWSLLNKLIIYFNHNSDIIRRGVSVLIRGTRCVLLYALRNREDWPLIVHVALSEETDPSDPSEAPTRRPIRPAVPSDPRTQQPVPSEAEAVEASVMQDVRVRAAYEHTPRVPRQTSLTINRMWGFPKKGLISLLSLSTLPRFPCPFKPEALVFLAQVPKVDFTPEIPENPEENPFPETKLCPVFHLAISKTFKWVSYPLINHFNYSKYFYMLSRGGGGLQVKYTSFIVCYIKKLFYILLYIQITCDL